MKMKWKSNSEVRYIFLLDKDFYNKCIHHNNKRLEIHSFEELKSIKILSLEKILYRKLFISFRFSNKNCRNFMS